jgi:hypothetical protein
MLCWASVCCSQFQSFGNPAVRRRIIDFRHDVRLDKGVWRGGKEDDADIEVLRRAELQIPGRLLYSTPSPSCDLHHTR